MGKMLHKPVYDPLTPMMRPGVREHTHTLTHTQTHTHARATPDWRTLAMLMHLVGVPAGSELHDLAAVLRDEVLLIVPGGRLHVPHGALRHVLP